MSGITSGTEILFDENALTRYLTCDEASKESVVDLRYRASLLLDYDSLLIEKIRREGIENVEGGKESVDLLESIRDQLVEEIPKVDDLLEKLIEESKKEVEKNGKIESGADLLENDASSDETSIRG